MYHLKAGLQKKTILKAFSHNPLPHHTQKRTYAHTLTHAHLGATSSIKALAVVHVPISRR